MGGFKRTSKAGAKEKAARGNPNTAQDLAFDSIIVALVSCAGEICKVKNYGAQPWLVQMPKEFLAVCLTDIWAKVKVIREIMK